MKAKLPEFITRAIIENILDDFDIHIYSGRLSSLITQYNNKYELEYLHDYQYVLVQRKGDFAHSTKNFSIRNLQKAYSHEVTIDILSTLPNTPSLTRKAIKEYLEAEHEVTDATVNIKKVNYLPENIKNVVELDELFEKNFKNLINTDSNAAKRLLSSIISNNEELLDLVYVDINKKVYIDESVADKLKEIITN